MNENKLVEKLGLIKDQYVNEFIISQLVGFIKAEVQKARAEAETIHAHSHLNILG